MILMLKEIKNVLSFLGDLDVERNKKGPQFFLAIAGRYFSDALFGFTTMTAYWMTDFCQELCQGTVT